MLTRDEAISLAKTGWWKTAKPRKIVALQLFEDHLCCDWSAFHAAIEKVLGRGVFTHEFADPERLRDEFKNLRPTPTQEEIIAEAQERFGDKMIVIEAPE